MGEQWTVNGLIDPGPLEFSGELKREDQSGASCFVQVPIDLKRTYGKGNLIPVIATFDGRVDYSGSLANMGGDHAVLLLRKHTLSELGKAPGDTIDVRVVLDTSVRTVTLGEDAQRAIDAAPSVSVVWEKLKT